MIISEDRKFIFIHIPKTGGTSLSKAFAELGIRLRKPSRLRRVAFFFGFDRRFQSYRFSNHDNLSTVESVMSEDLFAEFYKFTIVRNPWDRLVSEYEFYFQGSDVYVPPRTRWRHRWVRKTKNFNEFVRAKAKRPDALQCSFLRGADGELKVDAILRQESLSSDFEGVCRTLNVDCELKRLNVTPVRRSYSEYYTKDLFEFVREKWADDVESFGYESTTWGDDLDSIKKAS